MSLRKLLKYGGICLGILLLFLGITIATSLADDDETTGDYTDKNMYALRIATGTEDGEGVGLFSIRYSSGGNNYTEFLDPHEGAFESALETAAKVKNLSDTSILTAMGYAVGDYDDLEPLSSNNVDIYLMEFPRKVDAVLSITAYSDIGLSGVAVEWTCKSIEFFKVEKLNGLALNGGLSANYYIDFDGTLLAKSAGADSFKMVTNNGKESVLSFIAKGRKGSISKAYLETSFSEEEKKHTSNKVSVAVEIDIADVLNAGLEAYVADKSSTSTYFPEVLALRIYYKDTQNISRIVTVPVLASYLTYAKKKGLISTTDTTNAIQLMEFFGQGSKIVLNLDIYEFKELASSSHNIGIIYDLTKTESACGLVASSSATTTHAAIKDILKTDWFSITGISVYKNIDDSKITLTAENNAILVPSINAKPDYNFASATYSGDKIELKTGTNYETQFTAKEYNGTEQLRPSNPTQKFVLVMHTTDIGLAGTTDALYIKLGYTNKKNGEEFFTQQYRVQDLVEDYYGYWPDSAWNNCAYTMSVRAGGFVYALISLDGVYEFTSAQLTLVDKTTAASNKIVTDYSLAGLKAGTDAWQCQDLYIYQVGKSALTSRSGMWLTGTTKLKNGTVETDRVYYREFNKNMLGLTSQGYTTNSAGTSEMDLSGLSGVKEVVSLKDVELFLSESENSKTLDFATGSRKIEEHIEETDWRETGLYKEMGYADTQMDLGFAQKKCKYTVQVHVGTEEYATNNGDPGSANFFYFQLVFQNGNSAFVQANQQLAADAFIAGQTAEFYIYTNYDYGEVTSINIVPDDSSSLSSPYDKLKIDSIDVILDTGNNTSLTWTAYTTEANRWVGIDYIEEGEDATKTEEDSRDISDYMRTYAVSGRRLQSQVLVSFMGSAVNETGTITDTTLQADKISATFHVTKLDGTASTIEVSDIVSKMYDFIDEEPITQASGTSTKVVTDTDTMLKNGMRNYFIMEVSDIKSFDYVEMTIHAINSSSVLWQFQALDLNLIVENNGHRISAVTNQVILDGTTEIITKATDNSVSNSRQYLSNQESKTFRMEFEENEGPITEAKTEEYIQNRIPASVNDYLNVVVYMTQNGEEYDDIGLNCYFTYNNVYDCFYRATPNLKRSVIDNQVVFCANGVGAKNLVSIYSATVYTNSKKEKAKVEKIEVQVVREGTIINTYIIPCLNQDVSTKQIFYASASSSVLTASTQYQKVFLSLGSNTSLILRDEDGKVLENTDDTLKSIALTAETNDVAVAIRYKTKSGSKNAEYQSPFIFLTDQNIKKIGPNRVYELSFEQSGVLEITGVVISATGNQISLDVDSVAVATYEVGSSNISNINIMTDIKDGYVLSGWYSYETNPEDEKDYTIYAGNKTYLLEKSSKEDTSKAVVPISFYLTTMKPTSEAPNVELTSSGKIRANILYTKSDGTLSVYTIENILDYCTDLTTKSFTKGILDSFTIMVKDMTHITAVIFQPYDDDEAVTQYWGLNTMVISYGDGAYVNDIEFEDINITMNENTTNATKYTSTEYPGAFISLRNISFEVDVKTENTVTNNKLLRMFDSSISYVSNLIIRLGSDNPSLTIETYLRDSAAGVIVSAKYAEEGDSDNFIVQDELENTIFTFTPTILESEKRTYTITVRSIEDPNQTMQFLVVVDKDYSLTKDIIDTEVEDQYGHDPKPVTLSVTRTPTNHVNRYMNVGEEAVIELVFSQNIGEITNLQLSGTATGDTILSHTVDSIQSDSGENGTIYTFSLPITAIGYNQWTIDSFEYDTTKYDVTFTSNLIAFTAIKQLKK